MRVVGRPASPLPLYFTAMMEIREKILTGEWTCGLRIPGELVLAQKLGISVVTVRQALARLVDEGYLERQRAKGTFVSAKSPTRESIGLDAADDLMPLDPSDTSFELVSVGEAVPSREMRRELQIDFKEPVTQVVRMRLWRGRRLARVVSHLPRKIGIRLDMARIACVPLHALTEEAAGIRFTRVKHGMAARLADEQTALDLRIPAGSPVLWVKREYVHKRAAVLRSVGFYRSDLYNYELTLRRRTDTRRHDGDKTDGSEP